MNTRVLCCLILSICFVCSLPAQTNKHFINDAVYRDKVHHQFLERKAMATNRSQKLFGVFDQDITMEEREALEFLYAYMPLSDLADYDGDYFLNQVRMAFKARDYFDWGKTIPENVFRHFVLVYRINNEDLDDAREEFFEELKDRVKGMTMEQAALEVNHWCHEKVTYKGTDGRTSAPLALIKTSWGRCGEESTFTTAAMRAIGIPARQCYTPRWVHTDDNHAWVEVWIDGAWRYLGACEPEPELDVAWFTGPSKRAMMVHTNVFGPYVGKEEKNVEAKLYSVINLLSNYADTRIAKVKVVDEKGAPIDGATVKFTVYNYAEFYPISTNKTTSDGRASVITGNGDVFIWATDGKKYGYVKSEPQSEELTIVLDKERNNIFSDLFVMNPPEPQEIKTLSAEKIAANNVRLAYEDSIRNAYMQTFINEGEARKIAVDYNLDEKQTWEFLQKSQGNWHEIKDFIIEQKEEPLLFPFLKSLSEKDLRDTPCSYLKSHFEGSKSVGNYSFGKDDDFIARYIYSPRISLELIRPWRYYLQERNKLVFGNKDKVSADDIVEYIASNISIDNDQNYYKCPISPQGVYELGLTDLQSVNILFVALCRAEGIPARIDVATKRPQYYSNENKWVDVVLVNNDVKEEYSQGSITFNGVSSNIVKPAYSTHYSIAKYIDGDFTTLNFRNEDALKKLPGTVSADAGYYRLTIGSRANDGSVTVNTQYFTLAEGENKALEIKLPETEGRIQVQGIVDPNSRVVLSDNTDTSLKSISKGKGLLICFVDPGKEPSKHVLQDIPNQKIELEEWGGGILFVIPDDKANMAFDVSAFKNLPQQTLWAGDKGRVLLNSVARALQLDFTENFPLTVYVSSDGGVLYSSQGYQIGIPENILKTINAEILTKKQ